MESLSPRVLVVSSAPPVKRLPALYFELLDTGADLVFSTPADGLPAGLRERVATVELPLQRSGDSVQILRAAADLTRYLGPNLAGARWPRRRATRRLLKLVGHPDANRIAARAADFELPPEVQATAVDAFRDLEQLIPADEALVDAIDRLAVDAVLIVSRCLLGGPEPEVIKAARQLRIPSVMLVWSWDNLSSKAVLHEHPDRLLVWNELQAREAEELQGVAPERIEVVGAPNFDRFFAAVEAAGDRRTGTTIVYLGSSTNIAPDEPLIFARWLEAVRAEPSLREAEVVVRPHPAGEAWLDWTPPEPLVSLQRPEQKVETEALAQLLARADAVVALNTSAEIEAAIAGRPVLTFRAGTDAPGQEGSIHFAYLLEQNGGFVLEAATLEEHVTRLARVLAGGHEVGATERFVERFVRPRGIDEPVAPIVAAAALELAGAQPATLGGAA
jgi:hypothetical protein